MPSSKILIVEDSTFFRRLLKETLLSWFSETDIEEAGDAEEALRMVNAFTPDLIFVDIRLPGESGLELTRKVKTQYPDLTVIILTSYDLPEYREAATRYKANYFLTKGATTRDQIVKLVESILSERGNHPDGLKP
jgi:CheY-like chemotaxis protein